MLTNSQLFPTEKEVVYHEDLGRFNKSYAIIYIFFYVIVFIFFFLRDVVFKVVTACFRSFCKDKFKCFTKEQVEDVMFDEEEETSKDFY